MAKTSTKRSRSKSNSLPPAKRFDFTMVDDDFEELQRGFTPKETNADRKKYVKLFKAWASARNHHISSTIEMVPSDILLTDTALQLLETGTLGFLTTNGHVAYVMLGKWRTNTIIPCIPINCVLLLSVVLSCSPPFLFFSCDQ